MAPKSVADPKNLPSRAVSSSVLRMMAPRVLAAKAKPPRPSTLSPQPVAEAAPTEFAVKVSLSETVALGIDVDWKDGKTLFVKAVNQGAVSNWNLRNGAKAIQPGDRIIAVNKQVGNAMAMVNECRTQRQLSMVVVTTRPIQSTEDGPPAKKARDISFDSLYGGMPAPDPEKDKHGAEKAKESDIFADPPVEENLRSAIFLDIDGVLRKCEDTASININGETLPLHLLNRAFAPEAMRALKYTVHRTGASIVLSSEWRRNPQLMDEVAMALRAVGIPAMRGATPVYEAREEVAVNNPLATDRISISLLCWAERRAREISHWLEEHPQVTTWVALDDLDLSMADQVRLPSTSLMAPCLVKTASSEGLTMSEARLAIRRLMKKREGA